MQKSSTADTRKGLLLTLVVLGMLAALVIVPYQFRSEAGAANNQSTNPKGLFDRTEAKEEPMYDIREDQSKEVAEKLFQFRQKAGRDAVAVANEREKFVRAEEALKQRLPNAKVEYNNDIRIPEVITPDVWRDKIEFLTAPSDVKRSEILRNFIKQNNQLVGMDNQQIDALKTFADYTNPDGNLSFVELNQEIKGIPVFRGEIKAGFAKNGQMIRVVNNLAPGLDYDSLSTEFGNPVDAVKSAARYINHELAPADTTRNNAESTDLKVVFGTGDSATTAEKMYFPTEPGVAVPAWRVMLYQKVDAYYVIVDAETGTMLWRKNLVNDQTQSATYQIYANPNAFIPVADNPAPMSPGPLNPTLGTQAPVIARTSVTRIGNEAPYTFNNNGWINDGQNITDGNAVEAGLDRVAPDGVDAPMTGDPNRTFTSMWNPPPGNPAPGDEPLTAEAQRGAVIHMFYTMNWYHDELYRLGFTEQARNFQHDNFGRGGVANDRVRAEGQDSSGTNNANFLTGADGNRGRMQMYLWTGPTPDYDGTGDSEVIVHEVTHGLSNRLHGNGSGLGGQGGMMGEGWSDWYGHAMLSEPTDPINGIYTTGGYATHLAAAGYTSNYYHGIRRFPKAVIAFTGPNGKPHNPLTFRYLNTGCDTLIGTTTSNPPPNSAYPRGPFGLTNNCAQVHNAGEIWSSALWEVRALMVTRLGWAVGNRRVLQVVTDGMKLAPLNPTFLQERDAIITAASALPQQPEASADVQDVREGFRRRGMGFSASVQSTTAVTEAFDFPNVVMVNPFSVSDASGNNNGFPEPGEAVLLSVAVTNTTGATINNVVGTVAGGGSANYGSIADGATVTREIPYTVPAATACGSMHQVQITISSEVGAQTPQTREFRVGVPVGGAPATFSNTAAITIADNAPSSPYPSNITVSGLSGNKIMKLNLNGLTHTFPGDIDILLVGPGGQKFTAMSDMGGGGDVANINLTLADGATAALSTTQLATGTFRPGNTDTTTDAFPAPAPTAPYDNPAPAGTATFASAFTTAGANLNGTWALYVRDDAGTDTGQFAGGWSLTFEANDFSCAPVAPPKSRADFDGDGKTDLSVFRPTEGNWYLNRSTDGFSAVQFGVANDIIVPGNYDSDSKTDVAVFRPSEGNWYLLRSTGGFTAIKWGTNGDIPQPGNYDSDPEDELAVYRPSEGNWYITNVNGTGFDKHDFGQTGDIPVSGDYTGDGIDDVAVFRPSNTTWYVRNSANGALISAQFGIASDMPVPGDYNGDNKEDYAVFRPSNGTWYIARPTGVPSQNFDSVQFGANGDVPVPGDYDGDGKDDMAVYRNGTWYLNRSTSGFTSAGFGVGTDRAVPKSYIP
ncbi:MAG: M36 family metallopeptidase [Acidobacteriota bacterium]|nr:M36 family metallopeptidase [Acidobacteriota bacterium]